MDVEFVSAPARQLAVFRYQGPYAQKTQGFQKLIQHLPVNAFLAGWGPVVGVYQSDPDRVAPDQQVYLAGCQMPVAAPLPDGLSRFDLPAQRIARHVHVGPYEQIPAALRALYGRLRASGARPANAPPFEAYLNDPARTPPSRLQTALCIPIDDMRMP